MASGDSRVFKGAYVGTGAELSIEAPGFKPSSVTVIPADGSSFSQHIEGMDDGTAFNQKAGTSSKIASQAITLDDSGFNVGTNADLNSDGSTYFYICSQ